MLCTIPMLLSFPCTLPIRTSFPKYFLSFFLMKNPCITFGMKFLKASANDIPRTIAVVVVSTISTMRVSPSCCRMNSIVTAYIAYSTIVPTLWSTALMSDCFSSLFTSACASMCFVILPASFAITMPRNSVTSIVVIFIIAPSAIVRKSILCLFLGCFIKFFISVFLSLCLWLIIMRRLRRLSLS